MRDSLESPSLDHLGEQVHQVSKEFSGPPGPPGILNGNTECNRGPLGPPGLQGERGFTGETGQRGLPFISY